MRYLSILFFTLLIISCRNNGRNNGNITRLSETDSLENVFLPIINGDWARVEYVEDLRKTLSPLKTYDNIGENDCALYINSKRVSNDSLLVYVSFGGGGSTFYSTHFKKGGKPNSILLERYAGADNNCLLGFEIHQADTNLILYECDSSGSVVNSIRYLKARNELTGDDSIPSQTFTGLAYYRNKLLVSGTYNFVDTTGKNGTAIFNDFGRVKGFGGFNNYYVEGVFGQGPPDTDLITFNYWGKPTKDYLFKINKDTLSLFDFTYNDQYVVVKGSPHIAYKLIRQK